MAKGAAFEAEVQKSAVLLGVYYRKLIVPMKLVVHGGAPRLIKLQAPPYDGFIVYEGRHIALEMKSSALLEAFPLERIESHQVVGLSTMIAGGCQSFILFNARAEMRDGKKKRDNRAWLFSMSRWQALHEHLGDRKSIPADLFHDPAWFTPIPRIRLPDGEGKESLCWDLRALLSGEKT